MNGLDAGALALDGAHLFNPRARDRPFKEWVVTFAHQRAASTTADDLEALPTMRP
jgi:hypothetical protein